MAFFHIANFLVSPSECVVRVYSVVKKGSRTQYRESWFKDYRKESAVLVTFTCFPRRSDSQNLMRVKRSFPILWPICYSLTKSYPTFLTPWDCSMPGFPIVHYLPEFAQTHVHWVDDAIQPSHPLSPSFPPNLNPSQHQGLFQWVGSFHQVPKYWRFSFSISPFNEYSGWFPLESTSLISLLSKGLPRVFSNTTVQKHQFCGTQPSL